MCAGRVLVQLQLFVILFLFISQGSCLQCYKCYGTSRNCYNGNTEHLNTLNCSRANEVCATYKYQVDDSSVSYITTIRGCQPIVQDGICSQLMTTKKIKNAVQTGILCNTCNTDLCNDSSVIHSSYLVLFATIIINYHF